jgi:hypothetical protein
VAATRQSLTNMLVRFWSIAVAIIVCACAQTPLNEGAPAQPYPQGTSGSHSPNPMKTGVQVPGCSTDTARARVYRDGYASMVSRTDEQSVAQRAALKVPTLLRSQVIIVTDHSVCSTASTAFDKTLAVSAANEAPIVLQLGTHWAVVKNLAFRHYHPNVIFDSTFTTAVARIWF